MDVKGARKRVVVSPDFEETDDAEVLQKRCRQLRNLFSRAVRTLERERLRLARQLHDGLAQKLTALSLELTLIDQALARKNGPEITLEQIQRRLKGLSGLVSVTIQSARKLTSELHPMMLEEFGLAAMLEAYAAEFQQHIGIPCVFSSEPKKIQIDLHLSIGIFRIAQEALLNAARHARATRVEVRLTSRGGWITLHVQDNGRGVTEEELASMDSLGVAEMRERAGQFGGRLKMNGVPADGTLVVLRVPVRNVSGVPDTQISVRQVC